MRICGSFLSKVSSLGSSQKKKKAKERKHLLKSPIIVQNRDVVFFFLLDISSIKKNLQANAASSHTFTFIQLHTLVLQLELSYSAAGESGLVGRPGLFQVTALRLQERLGKQFYQPAKSHQIIFCFVTTQSLSKTVIFSSILTLHLH